MKNKGFTLIELLAVIIILGIIMGVATVSYNYQIQKSKKDYYEIAVKNMKGAAESMIVFCNTHPDKSFCIYDEYGSNYGSLLYTSKSININLKTLVDNGFMDQVISQEQGESDCSITPNEGYVTVTNNAGNANSLEYKVTLNCGNYRTGN